MRNEYNTFIEPVGSIPMTSPSVATNSSYQVIGRGGSVRHTGNFSSNNPYLAQLQVATKNQDKDALYELAVQWEADYANRQMQLAENRAILEEQREYDSPAAQVARQRDAGINPDIAGSSGSGTSSGSSAQLTNPGMADQTGQTKFSNAYDNTQLVFEGINTAVNFAGTLATSVSGIMNAVSTMKMLPSQIAANEAHADLQGAQANEIKELLAGKKTRLSLQNAAQGIENSSAILQQLAQFADLISPDTADMAPHLTALGVPEAQIPAYTDFIKQMHANPKMREQYAKASTAAKFSEAENDMFTQDLVSGMVDLQYKMEYEALDLQYHRNHLANNIASLLDTDDFAENSAELEIGQVALGNQAVGVQSADMELRLLEIENDTTAFLTRLEQKAQVINNIKGVREHIYSLAKGRSLTPEETSMINRLNAEEMSMYSLASSEFNQIKTTFLRTGQALYDRYRRLNGSGEMRSLSGQEQYNFYSDITFNDVITHGKTPGEIAHMWVSPLIQGVGTGVGVYLGAKGAAKSWKTKGTITNKIGKDGKVIPVSSTFSYDLDRNTAEGFNNIFNRNR